MTVIDRHSFVPLYYQLAQILRERIHTGELRTGDGLPSERELMQQYEVSRNTVREALTLLDRDGLIVRSHGSGTRVSAFSGAYPYQLDTFFENRDLLLRAGYTPTVQAVSAQLVTPPEAARAALRLEKGQPALCNTLIFFADGRPAMYTQDYLYPAMTGDYGLSEQGEGFLKFLDRAAGRPVEYVAIDLTPVEAFGEVAATFGCPPGSPVLLMKETFLDASQNTPIAFSMNYFNQELINFRLLTRRG